MEFWNIFTFDLNQACTNLVKHFEDFRTRLMDGEKNNFAAVVSKVGEGGNQTASREGVEAGSWFIQEQYLCNTPWYTH